MRAHWLPFLAFGAIASFGCAESDGLDLNIEPLVSEGVPPAIRMDVVSGQSWVSPGIISGTVSDADQPASTLRVELTTLGEGLVFQGNPDGDGYFEWVGALELGENAILVQVFDREGDMGEWTGALTARPNAIPNCRILSPREGDRVQARTDIFFQASVSDADGDPVDVLWRSNRDGALVNGTEFTRRLVTVGRHTISIEATDQLGEPCVDEVQIVVQ